MDNIVELKYSEIKDLRDKLLEEQKNICPITLKIIPEGKATLDHSHKRKVGGSGLIRGVIGSGANMLLGKIENNAKRNGITSEELPDVLRRMADFLERDHLPYIHPTEKTKRKKMPKRLFKKLKKLYNIKYPNRKELEYPISGKITEKFEKLFIEFDLEY